MRIQLTIDHLPNQKIPINYQYLISSWIYTMLHNSDEDFAKWLHEKGYMINGKKFKHFCFSMLQPKRFKIHGKAQVFELVEGPTELVISFNIDEGGKNLIKSVFQNNMMELNSGSHFKFLGMINQVQLLKAPVFGNHMNFRAKTPICISVGNPNRKYAEYLSPKDERFAPAFKKNLVDKANSYLGKEHFFMNDISLKVWTDEPKRKRLTITGTKVIGYLFDFELKAPKELLEIGYYAGFGRQNSMGFGFCEVLENKCLLCK